MHHLIHDADQRGIVRERGPVVEVPRRRRALRRSPADLRSGQHAQTFGALYFELSSHAMYGKPYAHDQGQAFVTRMQAAFEAAYARLTDATTARRLARLTLAVGQG